MQQQLDVFVASLTAFWTQLAGFVPQLLAALVLLFVGWLLANLAKTGVMKLLDVLKFDSLAEKTGMIDQVGQAVHGLFAHDRRQVAPAAIVKRHRSGQLVLRKHLGEIGACSHRGRQYSLQHVLVDHRRSLPRRSRSEFVLRCVTA